MDDHTDNPGQPCRNPDCDRPGHPLYNFFCEECVTARWEPEAAVQADAGSRRRAWAQAKQKADAEYARKHFSGSGGVK